MASAEHKVSEPRTIPDASRIRAPGVSREEPKDWTDDDLRTSKDTSMTCSSFKLVMALAKVAGAPFFSIPSSYFPSAQAFPISPMASTVAAKVSMAF